MNDKIIDAVQAFFRVLLGENPIKSTDNHLTLCAEMRGNIKDDVSNGNIYVDIVDVGCYGGAQQPRMPKSHYSFYAKSTNGNTVGIPTRLLNDFRLSFKGFGYEDVEFGRSEGSPHMRPCGYWNPATIGLMIDNILSVLRKYSVVGNVV